MVRRRMSMLGVAVTFVAACHGENAKHADDPPSTAVPGVETAVAATAPMRDVVRAAGIVSPDGLTPEARDARSDLAAAEARLRLASQQVTRLRALAPSEVSPRKDLEAALAEEASARAAADRARQIVDALGGATGAPAGAAVTWIVARVPQEVAPLVETGATADFVADLAGRPSVAATVAEPPTYVDPASRTAPVRVRTATRDPRLLPGMTGTVAIEVGAAHDAVVIPEAAVVYDERRPLVFVADARGGFAAKPVVLGVIRGGRVEIRDGLAAGTTVATTGAASLLSATRLGAIED
jgi:hypothetical protein